MNTAGEKRNLIALQNLNYGRMQDGRCARHRAGLKEMAYGKMRPARKGRKKSPKPTRDSIRVKLGHGGGPWTLDQLRAMMIDALDQAQRLGVTHVARANLYLNPVDERGNVATVIDRQPLPDLDIPRPYRSAAEEHGL